MRIPLRFVALGLLLALGCSGVRVSTDFERDANLGAVRRFAFAETERERTGDLRADSPFLASRVENAVANTLAGKGVRKVEPEDADVLIAFHAVVDSRLDAVEVPATFGYGPYWGGFYGSRVRVDQYETLTIVIDMVERGSDKLVWRGSGESRLRDHGTPEQRAERVQRTIDAIFQHFPPRR